MRCQRHKKSYEVQQALKALQIIASGQSPGDNKTRAAPANEVEVKDEVEVKVKNEVKNKNKVI